MEIKLISFGKISEFLQDQTLVVSNVEDTDQLKAHLESSFPELSAIKYKLAVNQSLIQNNTVLKSADTVAIMPPFSGG